MYQRESIPFQARPRGVRRRPSARSGSGCRGGAVDAIGGETQVVAGRGVVDRGGVPLVHAVLVPLGEVLSRTPRWHPAKPARPGWCSACSGSRGKARVNTRLRRARAADVPHGGLEGVPGLDDQEGRYRARGCGHHPPSSPRVPTPSACALTLTCSVSSLEGARIGACRECGADTNAGR